MALTLTLSGIVDGQDIDASDVTTPFNQIKTFVDILEANIAVNAAAISAEATARAAADTAIVDGTTALKKLVFDTAVSVTIATGAIAASGGKSLFIVDTESAAASDDLDRITGLSTNQVVVIRTANSARDVVIKHNAGGAAANFINATGADVTLGTTNDMWVGLCIGSTILQINLPYAPLTGREQINTSSSTLSSLVVPDGTLVNWGGSLKRLAYQPDMAQRNTMRVKAANIVVVSEGMPAVTMSATGGTLTESNQADSTYVNLISGTTTGNIGGFSSTTFNLVQRRHNPIMHCIVRTPSTITSIRFWVGLVSILPTGGADLTGNTIGFRAGSADGDTGWRGVCDDNSAVSLSTDMGTLTADTRYDLRLRVDDAAGMVYFSIDGGVTETTVSTNLPAASQNLGLTCIVATLTNAARSLLFSRMTVTYA